MRKYYSLIVAVLLSALIPLNAQKLDLQAFIDGLRSSSLSRADDVVEIDLANFNCDLTQTLKIKGQSLRFINGTLKFRDDINGNVLVSISENAYVEIAESAIFTDSPECMSYTKIVELEESRLNIIGGKIIAEHNGYGIYVKGSSSVINVVNGIVKGHIINDDPYSITLNGGIVDNVELWDKTSSIYIGGNLNLKFVSMTDKDFNIKLQCISPIENDITYSKGSNWTDFNLDNVIAVGHNYNLTKEDLNHIFLDPEKYDIEKWELYLEDNCVKVREKSEEPSLKTADDLQAIIDKIASDGNTYLQTIVIPEDGIVLEHHINVPSGCRIILTGGTIKVGEDFDKNTGSDMVFGIQNGASLELENITYDGNNQFHHYSSFFNSGSLTFGENVSVKNLYAEEQSYGAFIMGSGSNCLRVNSGEFVLKIPFVNNPEPGEVQIAGGTIKILSNDNYNPVITGKVFFEMSGGKILHEADKMAVLITEGYFSIRDGYIHAVGDAVSAPSTSYMGGEINAKATNLTKGSITGSPSLAVEMIYASGSSTVAGDVRLPKLQLQSDTKITITSALQYDWALSADWMKFELETPFLLSNNYTITKEDFAKITFLEMPLDREAYYDEVHHTVQLREKDNLSNSDDLQKFIDGLAGGDKGTPENPVEIVPSEDGLDIDKDVDLGNDLQAFIDGLGKNGKENKVIRLCGGNLTIGRGSCITFKNLQVDGCNGSNHIYVHGTLIIDIDIYIRNFQKAFVHVMPGGKVIWRGGDASGASDIIRNEGGTIEVEGGKIVSLGTPIINLSGTINVYYGTTIIGAITSIINGGVGSTEGTILINGATVMGGIINYGSLSMTSGSINGGDDSVGIENYGYLWIEGGYISGVGGSRSIWTQTDIYLCGCTDLSDIYIARGVKVYITEEMSVIFRIHFIDSYGFETGESIIEGAAGYTLTEMDCEYFVIPLPDNYIWSYDKTLLAVVITDISGINTIISDDSEVWDVYSLDGIKVGRSDNLNSLSSGIYIINGNKIYLK